MGCPPLGPTMAIKAVNSLSHYADWTTVTYSGALGGLRLFHSVQCITWCGAVEAPPLYSMRLVFIILDRDD